MAKNNIMSVAEFLQWEKYSRDTIDLKRTYIDITGDLVCGVLLSQIMYWHLPDKEGKTKMNVVEEGKYWIRKKREDWWEECRITPKQFDRASAHLCKLGFAESKSFIFSGRYTKHIRLNIEKVIYAISTLNGNGNSPKSSGNDHSSKGKGVFPKGSIIDSSEGKGTDVINPCNNCKSEHENLQTTEKTTNKDIPYSRKKKEKPKSVEKTSVDKPSVQYGTVDSRFSLADSKEKKFSQILKNKKIEIPNIERKDLKKNFVGNPAKFKDKKARLGNSQVEKGEYPGAWDALHSLPDDNPHKKLGLAYIEHETKKWDFSNTKNPEVVYKMFCLEYILDAPNALHFLYCLKKDLLKDDLDAYHTRNGLRKSNPIDESKDLLEMWENKY